MSKITPKPDNGLFADDLTPGRGRPPKPKPERSEPPKKRGPKPKPKTERVPILSKPGRVSNKDREPGISGTNDAISNILDNIDRGDNNIDLLNDLEQIVKSIDMKEKMSIQELKFIEFHIVKGESKKRAMLLAGYRNLDNNHLYWIAKKIVQKYEGHTEDHRIIMRAIGAGEVAVAAGLFQLARTAASEVARVAAYTTLSKMLGMQKEILQGSEGVTVIIQGPDACVQVNAGSPGLALPAPTQPAYQHPQPTMPGKPITIIK